MSQIEKAEIEHVTQLARLKLTENEKEKFTHELGDILSYIDELNQKDTSAVGSGLQVTGLSNMVRQDRVVNLTDRDNLLSNAPATKNGAIKVKQVFEASE